MTRRTNLASACAFAAAALMLVGLAMHFVLRSVMLRSFESPPLGSPVLTAAIFALVAVTVATQSIALWTVGDQNLVSAPVVARLGQWTVAGYAACRLSILISSSPALALALAATLLIAATCTLLAAALARSPEPRQTHAARALLVLGILEFAAVISLAVGLTGSPEVWLATPVAILRAIAWIAIGLGLRSTR